MRRKPIECSECDEPLSEDDVKGNDYGAIIWGPDGYVCSACARQLKESGVGEVYRKAEESLPTDDMKGELMRLADKLGGSGLQALVEDRMHGRYFLIERSR
jgi:hypothetical protein